MYVYMHFIMLLNDLLLSHTTRDTNWKENEIAHKARDRGNLSTRAFNDESCTVLDKKKNTNK